MRSNAWKVLLVDDSREIHELLSATLAGQKFAGFPYEIEHAFSAEEAKSVLSASKDTAVAIVDAHMGTADAGYKLASWIRDVERNRHIRLLLYSGTIDGDHKQRWFEQGTFNFCLPKHEAGIELIRLSVTSALVSFRELINFDRERSDQQKLFEATARLIGVRRAEEIVPEVSSFLEGSRIRHDGTGCRLSGGLLVRQSGEVFSIAKTFGTLSKMPGAAEGESQLPSDFLELVERSAATEQVVRSGPLLCWSTRLPSGAYNHIFLESCSVFTERQVRNFGYYFSSLAVLLKNTEIDDSITATQRDIIFTLGEILESRSKEAGNHVHRVAAVSRFLAGKLGLEEEEASQLWIASPMHDIGKVAIPDAILNKPGRLTADEISVMRQHTVVGHQLLSSSAARLLPLAASIARSHHEHWDGSGYPDGLRGTEIPVVARITCVADVFDALCHARAYKKAWSYDETFRYIEENSGTKFDPQIAAALISGRNDVIAIVEDIDAGRDGL
jgi:response regulator RpfG family c-di-GMP phosphodiesterase